MPTRANSSYLNGSRATVEIDMGQTATFVDYSGFGTNMTDPGATSDEAVIRDFSGGKTTILGDKNPGEISFGMLVTPSATDLYMIFHAADLASPKTVFDMTVATTKGGTLTWTYTGCQVKQLSAADMNADTVDAARATGTLSYESRAAAAS